MKINRIKRSFLSVESRLAELEAACTGPSRWGEPLYDGFEAHPLTAKDFLIATLRDPRIKTWQDYVKRFDGFVHLPKSWQQHSIADCRFNWTQGPCEISIKQNKWYPLYHVTVTATRISHEPDTAAKPLAVRDFSPGYIQA